MPLRVAVLTTSAGQCSTFVATALAWDAAEEKTVVLVDADPQTGTVANVFGFDPDRRLSTVWAPGGLTSAALQSAVTRLPQRPQLGLVAGFARPITDWPGVFTVLGPALLGLPCDVVIVDLGAPFTPAASSARPLSTQLGEMFDIVVLVLRVDHDLVARSVRILQGAPLPRTRLVLMRPEKERGGPIATILERELPWLGPPLEWSMNRKAMLGAAEVGRVHGRRGVAAELGVAGQARLVPRKDDRHWRGRRRPRAENRA